jgi:hypothetical protein
MLGGDVVKKSILDSVRTACRSVARNATYVRINVEHISSYALSLPLHQAISPVLDPQCHYLDHGEDTLAFILMLDSVNFGSGYFPHLQKRPGMSGYFTIASALNDHFNTNGPFSAEALRHISLKDCATVFNQDLSVPPVCELMGLFQKALADLGAYVTESFDASFVHLVTAANGSADELVKRLIKMPFFNDVATYDKGVVPFYKRAQLTAADLALAFGRTGWGQFDDLDNLTIFADNLVPHVLRVDQVIAYDAGLAQRIDSGELLEAGSAQEVEIRACAVHAVELIKKSLLAADKPVTSSGLDYLLWNRGQKPFYKSRPRHRARSVYY